MHAPAQGTGPPGRSCGAAEGQAGLAVTQKAAQTQAAGSWTLQGGEGTGVTVHEGFTGTWEVLQIQESQGGKQQEIGEGN